MYYVYLLQLKNGQYYAGSTLDIKHRLGFHNQGGCRSTKNKRPLKLVWYAGFRNKKIAENFEKYLKSSSGFAFRNKHLI